MISKYGVFTPYSLNLYSECNTDSPANFLKRNAILFEHLVIVPQGIGPLDGSMLFTKSSYLNAFSREEIKNKSDFGNILLTIDDFVEEDKLKDFYQPSDFNDSMWAGEYSDRYLDFVYTYVQNKLGLPSKEIQSKDHWEELKYYIGTISTDFQILHEARKRLEGFSALFTEMHENAFKATYNLSQSKIDHNPVINQIEEINCFDFGILSWDEIIELRKSEFVKDFRFHMFTWINEFYKTNDVDEFQKKINKFINTAKFDFIDRHEPDVSKSIISGIIDNIPLPIPVNPISVLSTISDIRKESKERKEFGWLFFVQKAFRQALKH